MERLQASEAATLVVGLIAAVLLLQVLRDRPWGGFRLHLTGAGLILAACALTVVEGYLWPSLLNVLEHLCLMLAGITFVAAVARGPRRSDGS